MSQSVSGASVSFRKRRPKLFVLLVLVGFCLFIWTVSAVLEHLDRRGVLSGPRLGQITLEGFIGDASSIVQWAETLRRDDSVVGVLLRIDSPGGAVAPSQEIYAAVKRLAEAKPVVVSMGTVAASGGYYVAVAGREIFANPSTLTGSIGVRVQITNMQGLLERIGVSAQDLTTGKFKAVGSPLRPMTDEEKAYLMGLLADMQDEFVTTVAYNRKLTPQAVAPYADGRVLTGRQALAAELVDRLGDREAAVQRLEELCNLKGKKPTMLTGPKKEAPLWRRLLTALVDFDAVRSAAISQYTFVY